MYNSFLINEKGFHFILVDGQVFCNLIKVCTNIELTALNLLFLL
jgi:hypothetical protein